jgi:nucleotide-binding universal stress UspA family protein
VFKTILCPVDGSAHGERALEVAIDMAKRYGASLVIVHCLLRNADSAALQHFAETEGLAPHIGPEVKRLRDMDDRLQIQPLPSYEDTAISSRALVEIGQHLLDDAKLKAEENGCHKVEAILTDGDPADQILRGIDAHKADCVVMGSRGLGDIKAVLLGSVSHKVINHSPCTCILVR